jgi:ferredoxin
MNILFFLKPKNEVKFIYDDDSLGEVMDKMELHSYSAIPLISRQHGTYIGTVTARDLLWEIKNHHGLLAGEAAELSVMHVKRGYDNEPVDADAKMEDLIDNCDTFENFEVITHEEKEFLAKMAEKLYSTLAVPCSECGYCIKECPSMIPIPEYFHLYNASKNQPEYNIYRLYFDKLGEEKVPVDDCTYCGTCLDFCTQKIDIPEELEKVCEHFEEGFSPYA